MNVSFQSIEDVVVLTLEGSADIKNAPKLDSVCKKISENKANNILIDCTKLEYISSVCLRVLLTLSKEVKKNKGRLAVAHANALVQKIFEISGFVELFPFYDSVVTALNSFQSKG